MNSVTLHGWINVKKSDSALHSVLSKYVITVFWLRADLSRRRQQQSDYESMSEAKRRSDQCHVMCKMQQKNTPGWYKSPLLIYQADRTEGGVNSFSSDLSLGSRIFWQEQKKGGGGTGENIKTNENKQTNGMEEQFLYLHGWELLACQNLNARGSLKPRWQEQISKKISS